MYNPLRTTTTAAAETPKMTAAPVPRPKPRRRAVALLLVLAAGAAGAAAATAVTLRRLYEAVPAPVAEQVDVRLEGPNVVVDAGSPGPKPKRLFRLCYSTPFSTDGRRARRRGVDAAGARSKFWPKTTRTDGRGPGAGPGDVRRAPALWRC